MVKVRNLPNHSNMFLMWRNITGQVQTIFQMTQDDKISAQIEKRANREITAVTVHFLVL